MFFSGYRGFTPVGFFCLLLLFTDMLFGQVNKSSGDIGESFKRQAGKEQTILSDSEHVLVRHPAVILHRMKKSIKQLFTRPERLLDIGLRKVPGNQGKYARVLQYMFSDAVVEDVSFSQLSISDVSAGRIPALSVAVRNISLGLLKIDSMILVFHDVRFSVDEVLKEHFLFTGLESFDYWLSVSDKTLDRIAGSRVSVSIDAGTVEFSVPVKSFLLSLTLRARGQLLVRNAEAIYFDVTNVNLANLPFSHLLAGRIAREVNPLFSLSRYMGRARSVSEVSIDHVTTGERSFTIKGRGTFELEAP